MDFNRFAMPVATNGISDNRPEVREWSGEGREVIGGTI